MFKKYRSQKTNEKRSIKNNNIEKNSTFNFYFNFLKWHIITYYENFIRLYDNTQNYDIYYSETVYKFLLKEFFSRTNKNLKYEIQILNHNIQRINIIVIIDLLIFKNSRRQTKVKKTFKLNITQSTKLINIFSSTNSNIDREYIALNKLNRKY